MPGALDATEAGLAQGANMGFRALNKAVAVQEATLRTKRPWIAR